MIHRQLFMATAIIASVAISACSDMTAPKNVASGLPAAATNSEQGDQDESDARSGALHVTKECSQFTGLAGGFCTITSSSLKTIKVGTRVVYAVGVGPAGLDTDVMLVPPGPGKSTAFGHVVLSLVTRQGVVTILGGTGKFNGLHASAAISHLGGPNWAWDGTYSFSDDN
jgi:hypothetical protein